MEKPRRLTAVLLAAGMLVILTVPGAIAEVGNSCQDIPPDECSIELDAETGDGGESGGVISRLEILIGGSVAEVASVGTPLTVRYRIDNRTDSPVEVTTGAVQLLMGGIGGSPEPSESAPVQIAAGDSHDFVFTGITAGAGPMGWVQAVATIGDAVNDELESIFIAGTGTGTPGPAGPEGPQGPAGPGGSQLVVGDSITSAPGVRAGEGATASAECPEGSSALGGGGTVTTSGASDSVALVGSYPDSPASWTVKAVATKALGRHTLTTQAYVLCSL